MRAPSRPESFSNRLRVQLREAGPAWVALRGFERIVPERLFRVAHLRLLTLDPRRAVSSRCSEPLVLRAGAHRDLPEIASYGRSLAELHDRLERHDRLYLAERDGKIAGWLWLREGDYDEARLGVRFRLPAGDAFLYDAEVTSASRRLGVYGALVAEVCARVAPSGLSRIWIATDSLNRRALHAHRSVGGRAAGTLLAARLLSLATARVGSRWRVALVSRSARIDVPLVQDPPVSPRVLLLIHNLETGGAQVSIRHLAEGLDAAGCRPIVCGWRRSGELARVLEAKGITVEAPVVGAGALLRTPGTLRGLVRRHRIDLIHAHMSDSAVWALLLRRLSRTPFVITHHSNDLTDGLRRQGALYGWMRRRLLRASARRAAMNAVVSASVGERLASEARLGTDRIAVVPTGVPLPAAESVSQARRARAERARAESAEPTILFVGRLAPEKGADLLVGAAPAILARFPGARLLLVGEGPEAAALAAQAEALGVRDSVVLVGTARDVWEWLAKADLLAAPSRIEGLPLAVLEAMSWGVPVVATDTARRSRLRSAPRARAQSRCQPSLTAGDRQGLPRVSLSAHPRDQPDAPTRPSIARNRPLPRDGKVVGRRQPHRPPNTLDSLME